MIKYSEAFEEITLALKAIRDGYPIKSYEDGFIIVENPDFIEDNGINPNLVIDIEILLYLLFK